MEQTSRIPPSKDALVLDIKRANFQTMIWKKALDQNFTPPSPKGNRWTIKDGNINIEWISKEPAPKAVLELISCKNCKNCSRRCQCKLKGFKSSLTSTLRFIYYRKSVLHLR